MTKYSEALAEKAARAASGHLPLAPATLTDAERALGHVQIGGRLFSEVVLEQILAARESTLREQIAQAIEARDPYGTFRHLDESERAARTEVLAAARIARGGAR